ncbi:hypothetical protein F442_17057 [Phytophthora nicotianae P10297]|uniref:Piwi domain-containing protein n=1 Tax=Phytophthora nicotianae P10297 TaxID=1317064 RepID=W2YHW0_PHYNI|nr:hypothetical protein F442_17057 [Phytophthora nicotianae P10297]
MRVSSRAGGGSSGSAQQLKSNCCRVTLDAAKCPQIFQYHINVVSGGDTTSTMSEGAENKGRRQPGGRRLVKSLLRQVVIDAMEQHPNSFGEISIAYDGSNTLFSPSALPIPDDGVVLNVRCSARNGYGLDPPGVNNGWSRPFTVNIELVKELDTNLLQTAFSDSTVNAKPLVYALDTIAKAGIVGRYPSQCVTAAVLGRAKVQVLANLCLKINAKLGGCNAISLEGILPLVHDAPTILIGADVCYPKMEKNSRQSISSVAASLDRHSSKYAARLAVQSGHNDVSHLPQILWELFIEHYKHARRQPKHVVYYRSGVSFSRMDDVVQAEMRSLRKAFRMLAKN